MTTKPDIDALLKAVDAAQVTIRAYELNHRHMNRLQALFGDDWNTTGKSLAGLAADTIEAQRTRISALEYRLTEVGDLAHNLSIHARIKGDATAFEMAGAIARKVRGEGE